MEQENFSNWQHRGNSACRLSPIRKLKISKRNFFFATYEFFGDKKKSFLKSYRDVRNDDLGKQMFLVVRAPDMSATCEKKYTHADQGCQIFLGT
jgi:hypothetical protein